MEYDSSYRNIKRYDNDHAGQSGEFYQSPNGRYCKASDVGSLIIFHGGSKP